MHTKSYTYFAGCLIFTFRQGDTTRLILFNHKIGLGQRSFVLLCHRRPKTKGYCLFRYSEFAGRGHDILLSTPVKTVGRRLMKIDQQMMKSNFLNE